MGEARRRKLAGYKPEEKPKEEEVKRPVRHVLVGGPSTTMAMLMAIMAAADEYPKLPKIR